jgi:hypothetical protein
MAISCIASYKPILSTAPSILLPSSRPSHFLRNLGIAAHRIHESSKLAFL